MKAGQLFTAMVTPMKPDGSVDYRQAAFLADRLADTGSDGVVVSGTTGEAPTLSHDEKLNLFREIVNAVGGKTEVIAGTGSYDTGASIRLTEEAEKCGVDGIMLVTPYYNKPSQEGLYRHFEAISRAASLPVMLYNVPGRTNVNITPETVARLAEFDNIKAMKEASGDLDQVARLRALVPEDFLIFSGDDSLTLPMLAVGSVGVVSVASHLVGRRIKEMIDSFMNGNVKSATAIHLELLPLFRALFITTSPTPVKRSLEFVGVKTGPLRLPLVDLTPSEEQQIKDVLRHYGFLEHS